MNLDFIKTLCSLDKNTLKTVLITCLQNNGYSPRIVEDCVYAEGDIPILLVAHMDTVFRYEPEDFLYDQEKKILWGLGGAGFDDRAGIYAILRILQNGLRPYVLFTNDEESGALSTLAFSKTADAGVLSNKIKYMIELDRQGKEDAVYYSCGNEDFQEYVEQFGFVKSIGTFTDISRLMPNLKLCGVNLSVGYEYEHTPCEILYVEWLDATIEKVTNMLKDADAAKKYEYIEEQVSHFRFNDGDYCTICGDPIKDGTGYHFRDTASSSYTVCGNCYNMYYTDYPRDDV